MDPKRMYELAGLNRPTRRGSRKRGIGLYLLIALGLFIGAVAALSLYAPAPVTGSEWITMELDAEPLRRQAGGS